MSTALQLQEAHGSRSLPVSAQDWDLEPTYKPRSRGSQVNVGDLERVLSGAAGVGIGTWGISRGGLLGLALAGVGGALVFRGFSGQCQLYRSLGISTAKPEADGNHAVIATGRGIKVEEATTIQRPVAQVYSLWRDFPQLAGRLRHLEAVKVTGPGQSHWTARGPLGSELSWDAEIIEDRPNELISWRSVPGSDVDTAGSVHFADLANGQGTEVRVTLKYDPPGGKLGHAIASLFGTSARQEIRDDLRRFKRQLESGELPTTEGQPRGACRR